MGDIWKKGVSSEHVDDELFLSDDEDDLSNMLKYLLFHLGTGEYGIEISRVTGIEDLQKITRIPDMPSFMKGVINLRGKVIPVIDLRLRFGMEERACDDRTCILITDIQSLSVGLIVDTVTVVMDMDTSAIDPPPSFTSGSGKERYIHGLARMGDEVKILVDVEKIIREDDIRVLSEGIENRGNKECLKI